MSAHMKKRHIKVAIGDKKFEIPSKDAKAILSLVESINEYNDQKDFVHSDEVFKDLLKERPEYAIVLRGSRSKENLSQNELSKLTGIPVTTISKYENGERVISESQAKKFGKALRVSFKLFLG